MEIASIQEKLKEEGWNLSNNGVELIFENGKISDTKTLISKAIDVDLKSISQGTLPEDINKTKYEQIPGNIVLQIQKIKNLSCPKNSESKFNQNTSILKLYLTDGVQNVQAIQMDPIGNIHINTFPGSKIRITSETVDVSHGFLLLFNSNTQFLGGKVDTLVEKWELNKKLAKHTRDRIEEGGPPPWIGFGQKIIKQNGSDKNFKSLDLAKSNKDAPENSEFEAQRMDAILEASKISNTKVFGGGNCKLVDFNLQALLKAGFPVKSAVYALKKNDNNLELALRSLLVHYCKTNNDNLKSNSKSEGSEEKKGGKNRNRHKDDDAGMPLKPSGKVSLFEFLEDKLPFSEPPVETKPVEKRNGSSFKQNNRTNTKGNFDRGKFSYEDKRNLEKLDSKNQKKSHESSKPFSKFDFVEKRNYSEKKSEFGKFEFKKGIDGSSRTDKSFGNFKAKHEIKNGDYGGRNEFFKSKMNERRGQSNVSQSAIKSHGRSTEMGESKKPMGFGQANEKPPRFQKYQNQQADNQAVQNWNEHNFNRIPQSEYQLQNSIANLTLQQNIANYQNQNSQDGFGDVLTGVPVSSTKPNNLFYQNLVIPTSQSGDSRVCGTQNTQPPPQQSHMNAFGNRNVGGFIQQEVKNSTFSNIPNLQDLTFKNNGPLLHGYNDFQSVFGNARAPSTSYPNPPYLTGPNGIPPQSQKPWIWSKGDKCMARYWEDQMYYNAVVTAVSENTCVVRFTDYGNYEEVLQDHCIPITEES